ncbi:hypothetical protein L596_005985 [Steinernema carpocapsae]|uniref:Protein phosphatase inhibitor 2 n=1 Tax=Steinernema carpocapsae TaxID=34508 RepID=A0A4U8V2A9_STECR|nr:hypothetical protein L596_005985 [Steinernema carpocapsae]
MDCERETIPVPGGDHKDPNECLKLQPKKSILKVKQPSFDSPPFKKNSIGADGHARFDEMNILATYHPTDKDYGHMKIDEAKTPYHPHSDSETEDGASSSQCRRRVSLVAAVDAEKLAEAIEKNAAPIVLPGESDEPVPEPESLSPEQIKHKEDFEKKRRSHYNEGAALKAGKDHLFMDEDDDDE